MKEGIFSFLKDILFPVFCAGCRAEGEWWCAACRGTLPGECVLRCPLCERTTEGGRACAVCSKYSALNGVVALWPYREDEPAGRLITAFKYEYARDIAAVWKDVITNSRLKLSFGQRPAVVPVPLYARRERSRGFNQAGIVARILAEHCSWPLVERRLIRKHATLQQARLGREERLKNVAGAFVWQEKNPPPEGVVLVDDVYTTGATMQECARALKAAGAREVWGFALARD